VSEQGGNADDDGGALSSFRGCHFCELFLLSKSASIMEIKLKELMAASAFCLNACQGAGSWVYVL